jgi:hypothetical protein
MTEALKMFARSVLALIVLLLALSLAIIAFDTEKPQGGNQSINN